MKFPHENGHVGHVFHHGQLTVVGPHDKAGKTHRAARFAAWLLKTYGEEAEHEKRDSGHIVDMHMSTYRRLAK